MVVALVTNRFDMASVFRKKRVHTSLVSVASTYQSFIQRVGERVPVISPAIIFLTLRRILLS